jgi:hypothetical protein
MINEKPLTDEIAGIVRVGLDGNASVTAGDGHVLITITPEDFEKKLGFMLKQISDMVDQSLPHRVDDVHLLFRDMNGIRQQQFRLWHPLPQQTK